MKIALTGPSSTGKTTLMNDLLDCSSMSQIDASCARVDIRSLLRNLGLRADGKGCNKEQMRKMQWAILEEKQRVEKTLDSLVTDRSYLDLAAHWLHRDGTDDEETKVYVNQCVELASANYDWHIYLPLGRIPFVPDGERPEDMGFQLAVNTSIEQLLGRCDSNVLVLRESDRRASIKEILLNLGL
ncbi:MAG: ATP-binding protein [Pseudodesulfovibrio sp.]|uniref:NadR/Ttd14 AAA domain-containing protein n=1 Tax=Pseudodesulfovibrio aespoeensis (strain ATCC 700646 / DSM 10631 / Aspo-2) TaxID=643562 RepID=E6VX31_PSEA9|nr:MULTISPECIES: AAA family ATPase [Pseudodesulfovibrio]MBU4380590.1 ATP-binding protein [Pseudomonadota bacterium]MCG2739055.1 ATP-binding protein [Syntrophaceae bacterium]ADU61437.1 hypothetical protein Daes_0413 [Pseudodesulfovibrio aespoeensis Aspo-2]MBU4516299.1 ATP-binding protein [Pseudomonadota bacterium]MBU4522480.1 ATP-binding protein [Pseudomonadota bacterium]